MAEVTVSIPVVLRAFEEDGFVSVCVTLESGAQELTERDFTVTLTTADESGVAMS